MSEASVRPPADGGVGDARAAWVTRVLGIALPRPAAATEPAAAEVSLVRLGRARLAWAGALPAARAEMAAFRQALQAMFEGAEDPKGLVPAALARLEAAMAVLDNRLTDQLDAVLNADAAARAPLIGKARATMKAFRAHLDTDPVLAALDGNEVRPETTVTGPLAARLAEIDAAFS